MMLYLKYVSIKITRNNKHLNIKLRNSMYKKLFEGKKAVFFDLDGTVVKETEELMTNAIQKVLDDIEVSYINARDYKLYGYPISESWKVIKATYGHAVKEPLDELIDLTEKAYINIINNSKIEPTEGFWDLIYELKEKKSCKLALLTNTKRSIADVVINKLDIKDAFDLIICGDEVKRIKPSPEIYRKALKSFKLKPKEVLAFEDSPVGVESSIRAKVDTIVIWDRKTPKYLFRKGIIYHFEDFSPLPGNLEEDYTELIRKKGNKAQRDQEKAL